MTFTYCGKTPEDFGCYYIPDEDQISDMMGEYEQFAEDFEARDGGYYFGDRQPPKEFDLPCYYEDIDKKTMEQIVRWLDRRTSGRLVFDERPDVYYDVVPSAKIEFEDYSYTEYGKTLHAGEFTIHFTAYDPFGKLTKKFLRTGEEMDYSTNLISETQMPPAPSVTDTSFLVYNPGTERTGLILRVAGDAPNGQVVKNTTNGQELALLPFNQAITTTVGKWFEIDSRKGQVYLVGAATRELAFEYHDKGYIALEANLRFEDGKTISFSQGGNTVVATDEENGFSEVDIGKYIYTGDGWHKILSVSDVTIVGCGKNIADVVSPYQVASEPPASVISTITPGSIEMSVNAAINSTWVAWRIWWPVKAGMYTISAKIACDDESFSPGLGVYSKSDINESGSFEAQLDETHLSVTVTLETDGFIGLYAHFTGNTGTTGARTVRYYDIQIEEGSTATAYEPYHDIPYLALDNAQGQIESVAVEAGCRAKQETRKNIADVVSPYQVASQPNNIIDSTITPGSIEMSCDTAISLTWQAWRIWWPVKPQTNYTISAKMECDDDSFTPALGVYTKTGISGTAQSRSSLAANGNVTVNTNDNDFIGLYAHFTGDVGTTGARTVRYYDIQIEEGSTATGYEPYKSILPITGRENVEIAACGKNLLKPQGNATVSGVTYTLQADGTYLANGTVASTGLLSLYKGVLPAGQYTISGGAGGIQVSLAVYKADGAYIRTICASNRGATQTGTVTELTGDEAYHQAFIQAVNNMVGQTVTNVVLSPQLETGSTATAFEPYHSMGGGTVTPTEPLYGLPGAEDTVEASVDGDVLVTRRTAVLELDGTETNIVVVEPSSNHARLRITPAKAARPAETTRTLGKALCSHYKTVSTSAQWNDAAEGVGVETNGTILIFDARFTTLEAWKTYLAAQAAAGTPVTIVYELAAPETEALTAISPIVPQPGQLNLATDADALTATIHGSGWETVNDTSSIQDALANLDGDLASLINEVGLLNGEVGSIAQQIISPDGIKNIVFESTEYQAMANTVEQNANELSVTQTTVTDINGRVETIEGTVRISGSNIDIGRSDSNVQLHLDNGGWSISEGGQETIYARQNRVVAPRFQTTSLIFGALAFNSSGGHFRLMKYGG